MVNISKYGGAGMIIIAKPSTIIVTEIPVSTMRFNFSCSRYFLDSRLSTGCWVSKSSRFVIMSRRLCSWFNPLKASNFCELELLSTALFIFCCIALICSLSIFSFFSSNISSSAFILSNDSSLLGRLFFKGI